MKKNYKKFILIFSVIFLALSQSALALEVNYPAIPPFTPSLNTLDAGDFPGLVTYFFTFAIAVSGIFAVIAIVIAGFQYLTSIGKPDKLGDAKDRITSAILGVVLLLCSFIILKTINPNFISPKLNFVPPSGKLFYMGMNPNDLKNAQAELTDTTPCAPGDQGCQRVPAGYASLYYYCTNPSDPTSPGDDNTRLMVWTYTGKNFTGVSQTQTYSCLTPIPLAGVGSYKTKQETPGIYLYTGRECTGTASDSITNTQLAIGNDFKDKIGSIKIVNDDSNQVMYGFILSKNFDMKGTCSQPVLDSTPQVNQPPPPDPGFCKNISEILARNTSAADVYGSSSITIFRWNWDSSSYSSSPGVTFWNQPVNSQSSSTVLGSVKILGSQIEGYLFTPTDDMHFVYPTLTTPPFPPACPDPDNPIPTCPPYLLSCPTLSKCQGSMDISGNFLVAIYSETFADRANPPDINNNTGCTIFTQNVPDFGSTGITNTDSAIYETLIIPTK